MHSRHPCRRSSTSPRRNARRTRSSVWLVLAVRETGAWDDQGRTQLHYLALSPVDATGATRPTGARPSPARPRRMRSAWSSSRRSYCASHRATRATWTPRRDGRRSRRVERPPAPPCGCGTRRRARHAPAAAAARGFCSPRCSSCSCSSRMRRCVLLPAVGAGCVADVPPRGTPRVRRRLRPRHRARPWVPAEACAAQARVAAADAAVAVHARSFGSATLAAAAAAVLRRA